MPDSCWCPAFHCKGRRAAQPYLAELIRRRSYLRSLGVALARFHDPDVAHLIPQGVALSLVRVVHDGTAEQNAFGYELFSFLSSLVTPYEASRSHIFSSRKFWRSVCFLSNVDMQNTNYLPLRSLLLPFEHCHL